MSNKFISINEDGYFHFNGDIVNEEEVGAYMLNSLYKDSRGLKTKTPDSNESIFVEAFNEPIVAQSIHKGIGPMWELQAPYGVKFQFNLNRLHVDEWDRFCGELDNGLSFVFSRKAQAQFFELVDEFSDDSVTIGSTRYAVDPWLRSYADVENESFWSEHYRRWKDEVTKPGWDKGAPAQPLKDVLAQIKITKSRIAVLGAGCAHDADHLASLGHVVTAIDISPEAIKKAKDKYGHKNNVEYIQADAFNLPQNLLGQFDLVFEHIFFCSVNPIYRNRIVQTWKKLLTPRGHLLAIFFMLDQGKTPPFGSTEWELRARLEKHFRFLYWTRWRQSLPERQGKEIVVYAEKLEFN